MVRCAGDPTANGDSFTNSVAISGTSTPRTGTGETGTNTVQDTDSVTQVATGGSLTKTVQPRTVPQNCSDNSYSRSASLTSTQVAFRKGDVICFEITAAFSSEVETLSPVLRDILPLGTTYVPNSFVTGPDNTLPADQVNFDETSADSGLLIWQLGRRCRTARSRCPRARFSRPGSPSRSPPRRRRRTRSL